MVSGGKTSSSAADVHTHTHRSSLGLGSLNQPAARRQNVHTLWMSVNTDRDFLSPLDCFISRLRVHMLDMSGLIRDQSSQDSYCCCESSKVRVRTRCRATATYKNTQPDWVCSSQEASAGVNNALKKRKDIRRPLIKHWGVAWDWSHLKDFRNESIHSQTNCPQMETIPHRGYSPKKRAEKSKEEP